MTRSFKRFSALLFVALSVLVFAVGCKKNPTIEEVESRMKILTEKGAPDSVLANLKVYIYNYKAAKKLGNGGNAKKYSDSMGVTIVNAETWYANALTTFKPYLENLRKSIVEKKASLSGLQLKCADSLLASTDSLIKLNFLVAARTKMDKLDTIMTDLLASEKRAQEVKKAIVGKWGDSRWEQAEETEYKSKTESSYNFKGDGSFESSEARKGQTTPYMKEDWLFLSWGKYDVKGDTVFIKVTREKCPRQIFTQLNVKENKWKDLKSPTYDSTITNGAKDKFLIFTEFKADFKKK